MDADYAAKLKGTFDEALKEKRAAKHRIDQKARETKASRKLIEQVIKLRQQAAAMAGETDVKFGNADVRFAAEPEAYKILFVEQLPKTCTQDELD